MYTLADGVLSYLDSIDNDHTKRTYQTTLDRVLLHFGADTPLTDLSPGRVYFFIQTIRDSSLAYATRRKHVAIVKGLFSHLTAVGVYSSNPADKIRSLPPQTSPHAHHARLTRKERQHLLDTTGDNVRNEAMLRLIADTGLSAVQIAALATTDVSPAGRFVVYRDGSASYRVTMSDSTALALHRWCKMRPSDTPNVFGLSSSGVLQVIGRAYKAAGVRNLGIKGLHNGPVEKIDTTGKILHLRIETR